MRQLNLIGAFRFYYNITGSWLRATKLMLHFWWIVMSAPVRVCMDKLSSIMNQRRLAKVTSGHLRQVSKKTLELVRVKPWEYRKELAAQLLAIGLRRAVSNNKRPENPGVDDALFQLHEGEQWAMVACMCGVGQMPKVLPLLADFTVYVTAYLLTVDEPEHVRVGAMSGFVNRLGNRSAVVKGRGHVMVREQDHNVWRKQFNYMTDDGLGYLKSSPPLPDGVS